MVALPDAPNWVDVTGLYVQEGMLAFAVLQCLLGIAGTIALIITLRESRKATATALKALHVQQSAERAVLVVGSVEVYFQMPLIEVSGAKPHSSARVYFEARVRLTNRGRSIAFVRKSAIYYQLGPQPDIPMFPAEVPVRAHNPLDVDAEFILALPEPSFLYSEIQKLRSEGNGVWLYGFVEYDDLFQEKHKVSFGYQIWTDPGGEPEEFGGEVFWQLS